MAAESPEPPPPLHLSRDVHILFIEQGTKTWAEMVFGQTVVELGPVRADDAYGEEVLRLAAAVLVEHPRWLDEVHLSQDRKSHFLRIGRWVLTYKGPTGHARYVDEIDAHQGFAELKLGRP